MSADPVWVLLPVPTAFVCPKFIQLFANRRYVFATAKLEFGLFSCCVSTFFNSDILLLYVFCIFVFTNPNLAKDATSNDLFLDAKEHLVDLRTTLTCLFIEVPAWRQITDA